MSDTPATFARATINVVVRPAPNDGWFEVHTGKRDFASPNFRCAMSGAGFLPEDTRPRPSSPSDMIFPGPR